MLVLKGVLGTLEVWYSVSLVWGVFGERYKRLVLDSPLKLAIWESPSQENLGLSLWALLTRTWTCGREHVQGYWTSSPTMKVVMVGVLYRTSTNRLQKQGTTPTSSATKSARHSKIWRVKGNYAPLLALFLLPSILLFQKKAYQSIFVEEKDLFLGDSYDKGWRTRYAEGGENEYLHYYTSVHKPSIPVSALCIVWHNLNITDIARFR